MTAAKIMDINLQIAWLRWTSSRRSVSVLLGPLLLLGPGLVLWCVVCVLSVCVVCVVCVLCVLCVCVCCVCVCVCL